MKRILSNTFSILYQNKNKKHFWIILFSSIFYIGFFFLPDYLLTNLDVIYIKVLRSFYHIYVSVILFFLSLLLLKEIPSFIVDKKNEEYKVYYHIHKLVMKKIKVIAIKNNFKKRFLIFLYLMIFSVLVNFFTNLFVYYGDIKEVFSIKISSFSSTVVFSSFIYTFLPFSLILFSNSYKKFEKKYLNKYLILLITLSFTEMLTLPTIVKGLFSIMYISLFLFAISLLIVSIYYEFKSYKLNIFMIFLNSENISISDTMKEKIESFKEKGLFREFFDNTLNSKIIKDSSNNYINLYMDLLFLYQHDTESYLLLKDRLSNYKKTLYEKNKELESKKYVDTSL